MLRSVKITLLLIALVVCLADSLHAYHDLAGDLNEDYVVDWEDLRIFAWQWVDPGCLMPGCISDLDGGDGVNMADYALLAENWQMIETPLVISEVMTNSYGGTDWIELHNTTEHPIDIGGWFLSAGEEYDGDIVNYDSGHPDDANWMKYRIADGMTIEPNGYVVFYEDVNFGNLLDPGCIEPFTISANGGWDSLSSRLDPNGFLTGYRQVQVFGASQTNVSFGRYYKSSTDTFDFVAMDYNTPDANNSPPKVGPVVVNEIMYNPPTGYQNEEYIELHNITTAPFTLFRFDKVTPWKFTDGIEYTFPISPPVTIPAYGYLLLVKDKAAFTARYGSMPSDVQVLSDYDGWLSNDSGSLEISMPGEVDEFGSRFYIRIDRVDYSDGSHPENCPGGVDLWPTEADGLGKSLSRKVPTDYGNDVVNWNAAAPSPGSPNP